MGKVAGIGGAAIGGMLGGPSGAAIGGTIGSAIGGGGRSGGGGGAPGVVQSAPWSSQIPHLEWIMSDAKKQYLENPITMYPGAWQAQPGRLTQKFEELAERQALQGAEYNPAAQQLQKTLGGDYLYGGEGFQKAYQAAARQILPEIQSRYARAGRFGSGAARQAEAQALGDVFARQYGAERDRQMQAMKMAPDVAKLRLGDLLQLSAVGSAQDEREQAKIDEAIQRFEFDRDQPDMRLRRYADFVRGNYGGQQYSYPYQPPRGSGLSSALGQGLMLAQLFGGKK